MKTMSMVSKLSDAPETLEEARKIIDEQEERLRQNADEIAEKIYRGLVRYRFSGQRFVEWHDGKFNSHIFGNSRIFSSGRVPIKNEIIQDIKRIFSLD